MKPAFCLLLLAASCSSAPQPTDRERTFEQCVVAIRIGMSTEQVEALLGTSHTNQTKAEGEEVWQWSRRSMGFHMHDAGRSSSMTNQADVTFRGGAVTAVAMHYMLVH